MHAADSLVFSPRQLRRVTWLSFVLLTVALAVSVFWNVQLLHNAMLDAAEHDARSSFDRDVRYLLDPAAMTREVHELKAHEDGTLGHITSLKPKSAHNTPDAWETSALQTFVRGQTEAIARVQLQGQSYLRFMKPVFTGTTCLECHGDQGYRQGDLRGGISVAVPLAPYLAMEQTRVGRIVEVHAGLWVLGALGIFFAARQLRQQLDDQLRAAAALRESEDRYRTVVKNVGEGIALVNPAELFTFANPASEDIFGVPPGGLLGHSLREFTTPEQYDQIRAQTARRQVGEQNAYEIVISRPDGASRHVLVTAVPQLDREGKFMGTVGVFRDITERRQAEESLRESEFFFKESQRVAHIGSYRIDFSAGTWIASGVLNQIFGIGSDYARTVAGWLALVHPADRAMMSQYLQDEVLAHQQAFNREYRIIRKSDGTVRWVHGLGALTFDPTGTAVAMSGTVQDITERRQAEETLQESEERFRIIFSRSPMGIALVDLEGHPFLTNTVCQNMLGRTDEELRGMVFTEFTHPEDCDKDLKLYHQLVAGERDSYQIEKRYVRKDGQLVWTSLSVTMIRDFAGQPKFALSLVVDITERKQAEVERERVVSELRQTLAETKTLSGLLPICAGCKDIRDADGHWNKIEIYIRERTGAKFTHGICPECIKKYYPELGDNFTGGPKSKTT